MILLSETRRLKSFGIAEIRSPASKKAEEIALLS
jgi:hypothetical protein